MQINFQNNPKIAKSLKFRPSQKKNKYIFDTICYFLAFCLKYIDRKHLLGISPYLSVFYKDSVQDCCCHNQKWQSPSLHLKTSAQRPNIFFNVGGME